MTKRLYLLPLVALVAFSSEAAFAGGHGHGRGGQTYTYNQNYSYDVGPNSRNLGYAGLAAGLLGALLAPPPVIVVPGGPAVVPAPGPGGVVPGGLPYGPGPASDGAFVGYVDGFNAGRAARVSRAINYHIGHAYGQEAGYADGLYGP